MRKAGFGYELTAIKALAQRIGVLKEGIQARKAVAGEILSELFGTDLPASLLGLTDDPDGRTIKIDLNQYVPDLQVAKSMKPTVQQDAEDDAGGDGDEGGAGERWEQTMQDDPFPSRPHQGRPGRYWFFVDPDYGGVFDWIVFAYMFPAFFLMTMNENPPNNFNMVEGCHDAWYGQYLNAEVMVATIMKFQPEMIESADNARRLDYVRDLTFSHLKPLEFLYGQLAFCLTSYTQLLDMIFGTFEMLTAYPVQILYNLIKNLGSIMFSFATFIDCFNHTDGECAGRRFGKGVYLLLNYRTNLLDYAAQLVASEVHMADFGAEEIYGHGHYDHEDEDAHED